MYAIESNLDITYDKEGLPLSGELGGVVFARVLHLCFLKQTSALLHVDSGAKKKVIYLRNGCPVFARSNMISECLGQMLVRRGSISKEQMEQSLSISKLKSILQGEALVEIGAISREQLKDILILQTHQKVLEEFSWTKGSFKLKKVKSFKATVPLSGGQRLELFLKVLWNTPHLIPCWIFRTLCTYFIRSMVGVPIMPSVNLVLARERFALLRMNSEDKHWLTCSKDFTFPSMKLQFSC
jgi:hypothetical protein